MNERLKKSIGWVIWELSRNSLALRKLLLPLGMRTKKEWYKNRIVTVYLANNKRVRLTNIDKNYLTFELFWKGWTYYEPMTILLFGELLKDADVFFDIGANIGYFSICAASERKGLQIVSFEPNPKLHRILKDNIRTNRFDISLESAAVSERTGTGKFYSRESDMTGSLENTPRVRVIDEISVPTVSLDDYIKEHNLSGRFLIKVDVEGHEPKVLRGAARTLKDHQPEMILEATRNYDAETMNFLRKCNYCFYKITNTGFHETDNLTLDRNQDYFFMNHLITTRSRQEINVLFNTLRDKIDVLNLKKTSLYHYCCKIREATEVKTKQ